MRPIKHIASFLAFFSMASLSCQELTESSVFISYGKINQDRIREFKYVILESEQYSRFEIDLMLESNQRVLGYISLGEVSAERSYYAQLKDRTLGKNEIWDSYFLDLTDETTIEVLLQKVAEISEKGFNGLFLDTIDVYGPWGRSPSQAEALASLLAEIKRRYPNLHLMQNSGIALLPLTNPHINSLALESIVTDYDFQNQTYAFRKVNDARERANALNEVKSSYQIDVVAIEYANTKRMYKRILKQLNATQWDYFIGQIELDGIPKFK